jgi:hypothetical protein
MAAKDTLKSALERDMKEIFKAAADAAVTPDDPAQRKPKSDDWLAENLALKFSDAIDAYAKSLGVAAGSVIVKVTGGSGAPAIGTANDALLTLSE